MQDHAEPLRQSHFDPLPSGCSASLLYTPIGYLRQGAITRNAQGRRPGIGAPVPHLRAFVAEGL
jgi:hypothetical protein